MNRQEVGQSVAIVGLGIAGCVVGITAPLGWVGPNVFAGDRPETAHAAACYISATETSCVEDFHDTTMTWTVPSAGSTWTRLSAWDDATGAGEFSELDGTLGIDITNGCAASVEWALTPNPTGPRSSGPPLTSDDEVDMAELVVPTSTRELIVELRRLDTIPCTARVSWSGASLK